MWAACASNSPVGVKDGTQKSRRSLMFAENATRASVMPHLLGGGFEEVSHELEFDGVDGGASSGASPPSPLYSGERVSELALRVRLAASGSPVPFPTPTSASRSARNTSLRNRSTIVGPCIGPPQAGPRQNKCGRFSFRPSFITFVICSTPASFACFNLRQL